MTRTDKVIRGITAATVVLLGVAAAVVSFRHAYAVSLDNGQDPLTSILTPVTIDLPILAASMVLLDSARRGTRRPFLAVLTLLLGIAATIAINAVYGAAHGLLGGLVAAWPAVALTLSVELLMGMIRRAARTAVPAEGSEAVLGAQVQPGTPSGTPTDSPVPTAVDEPVAAPEIRHTGTDSTSVPERQVRVPEPYSAAVPQAETRQPVADLTETEVLAGIRRGQTDFDDDPAVQMRTAGSDLRPEAESPEEWTRLLGMYPNPALDGRAPVESGSQLTDFAEPLEGPVSTVPDVRVHVHSPYPDPEYAAPPDGVRSSQDPANGAATTPDREHADEAEVHLPETYLDPDPHQVQAVKVFSAELGDGEVPSVRRIKATLKVGQPKAESVRDYLRRLVDAQPADDERVGADAR